jgi:hypothetical protein
MKIEKHITYGVLALLVVGPSEKGVIENEEKLTRDLAVWRKLPYTPALIECPTQKDTGVRDRWWVFVVWFCRDEWSGGGLRAPKSKQKSATTRSARPASPPISIMAGHLKKPLPW